LIEASILQAGPVSYNRDRDRFSASYCQKRKYHILVLVLQTQVQPAAKISVF